MPAGISPAGVVWRYGFVAELRIEAPDQLALLAEPALRFVDSVTLAMGDPNDEPGEVRWPDPEVISSEHVLDVDRQIAEPACREHESPFEPCSWCSARICIACIDTAPIEAPIDGVCASCLAALDRSLDPPLLPFGTSTPRARIVS